MKFTIPNSILLYLFLGVIIVQMGCIEIPNQFTGLPPGTWRGVLKLDAPLTTTWKETKAPIEIEEVTDGELPFNFEVIYEEEDPTKFYIEIINGTERIRVNDIVMALDRRTARDTLTIDFPIYDSQIDAIFSEDVMEGVWTVRNRPDYKIPFVAYHGKGFRFTTLKKPPKLDLTGKWEVMFGLVEEEEPYPAIGEFEQKGNYLTGTFLTETGDYRYLQGTVQGDKVYLSCFDGSHAFLFEAKIKEDNTLIGLFRSGNHYKTTWEAKRNSEATLRGADELTYLKEGYESIDFTFENEKGQLISLQDEKYQGKAKLIQIMGTWCPNCRDETDFLVDYLKNNPSDNLEIISVAFERYREKEKALKAIKTYKERYKMDYEMLYGGYYDKTESAKAFPMLNHILSYPTLIFVDKEDKVRHIHTGFSGPATSNFEAFKKEFEAKVADLVEK